MSKSYYRLALTTMFPIRLVRFLALLSSFTHLPTDAFALPRGRGLGFLSSRSSSALFAAVATITDVPTKPIAGMKPGTSGLRKKVEVWQGKEGGNEHYVENFIQSLIDTAAAKNGGKIPQTYVRARREFACGIIKYDSLLTVVIMSRGVA